MPRPSLKEERRAEILAAYARCVARYGVHGATLERTAEEAQLARALIRHNVGNKDDLFDAFLDEFLGNVSSSTDLLFASLPADDRLATMVEWLFDPRHADVEQTNLTNALLIAAVERPALAKRLRRWTVQLIGQIEDELGRAFPKAPDEGVHAVATGIAALYFNFDSLMPLGGMKKLGEASKRAVGLLISTLSD